MSFELKLVSNETLEISDEQAEILKTNIDNLTSIQVGSAWVRTSAIMAILPSNKNHPKYRRYLLEKSKYGYRGSFDTYLDEINYPREVNNLLEK